MRVGWIGLGMMGLPMARNAARAGFSLIGHTRGREEQQALVADGGALTRDAVACAAADILCLCLFDDAQVRSVLYEGGVLAAMRAGSVLVVHTTGDPALSRRLAADAPRGVAVVDGAFSGTVDQATDGTLTILAGGDDAAIAAARPLFESYAATVRHVGPTGAGMQLKLVNNLLFSAQVRLVGAAYALAAEQGFDSETVRETLGHCSAASRALEIVGAGGTVSETLARLRHYVGKDIAVATQAAAAGGIDLGLLGEAAAAFVSDGVSDGGGGSGGAQPLRR